MTTYRPIPGFPEYRAGSDGAVQSAWKRVGPPSYWAVSDTWTDLKPQKHKVTRYMEVGLKRGGKQEWKRVHVLVASAFLGPCPEGMEVSHIDGDRSNNRPGNLEYKTHVANCADKVRHGTNGSSRRGFRWLASQIREIQERHSDGPPIP